MLILDRLDDQIAHISSDHGMLFADRCLIDPSAKEGDVLRMHGTLYMLDETASAARRDRIRSLIRDKLNIRR